MIYHDKCYYCDKRIELEKQTPGAKEFMNRVGVDYIFECGARLLSRGRDKVHFDCEIIPAVRCEDVYREKTNITDFKKLFGDDWIPLEKKERNERN